MLKTKTNVGNTEFLGNFGYNRNKNVLRGALVEWMNSGMLIQRLGLIRDARHNSFM